MALGLFLIVAGTGWLAGLLLLFHWHRAFRAKAQRAEGRVVGHTLHYGMDDGGEVSYREVVEFEDESGKTWRIKTGFRSKKSVTVHALVGTSDGGAAPVLAA